MPMSSFHGPFWYFWEGREEPLTPASSAFWYSNLYPAVGALTLLTWPL